MVEVMERGDLCPPPQEEDRVHLSAMRHFAEELRGAGWQVDYVRLDDPANTGSFGGEVARACAALAPEMVIVSEPGEWRVRADMASWQDATGVPVEIREDTRFMVSQAGFRAWATGRKQLRMEFFYQRDAPARPGS